MSESKIQADFHIKLWNTYPRTRKLCFHVPNRYYNSILEGARYKAMGVLAGVPDYFIMIPANSYAGLIIEFKDPERNINKDHEANQAKVQNALASAGYLVKVCESVADAWEITEEYLKQTIYIKPL